MQHVFLRVLCLVGCVLLMPLFAWADEAGMIKTVKGEVKVLRASGNIVAQSGTALFVSDTVVTGPNSAVGITLVDGTLLSAGPKAQLALNKFVYDSTTSKGELDATLKTGTLSVVSGKLSKTSRDAVVYRTPTTILAVRGTEFIIDADAEPAK